MPVGRIKVHFAGRHSLLEGPSGVKEKLLLAQVVVNHFQMITLNNLQRYFLISYKQIIITITKYCWFF